MSCCCDLRSIVASRLYFWDGTLIFDDPVRRPVGPSVGVYFYPKSSTLAGCRSHVPFCLSQSPDAVYWWLGSSIRRLWFYAWLRCSYFASLSAISLSQWFMAGYPDFLFWGTLSSFLDIYDLLLLTCRRIRSGIPLSATCRRARCEKKTQNESSIGLYFLIRQQTKFSFKYQIMVALQYFKIH